jgi:hypothetical protein
MPPSLHCVSSNHFADLGFAMTNRSNRGSALLELRRFHAFFGVDPETCALLYDFVGVNVDINGAKPVHLLWALPFLKVYAAEEILCALVGGVDPKTFRKWAWYFVGAIASLEAEFVSCSLTLSLDGEFGR